VEALGVSEAVDWEEAAGQRDQELLHRGWGGPGPDGTGRRPVVRVGPMGP